MVELAADAARSHSFDEKPLRLSMAEIARSDPTETGATVNEALEEGCKLGVDHAMADGIITQDRGGQAPGVPGQARPDRLRRPTEQATAQLDKASQDRLTLDARLAAIATSDPEAHLNGLAQSLRDSGLPQGQQTAILVRAWEAAVEEHPGGRTPHPRRGERPQPVHGPLQVSPKPR